MPYLSLATESIDGFLSENEKCKHKSIFEKHAPLFTVMVDWMWNIFVACWFSLLLLWLLALILQWKNQSIYYLTKQTKLSNLTSSKLEKIWKFLQFCFVDPSKKFDQLWLIRYSMVNDKCKILQFFDLKT